MSYSWRMYSHVEGTDFALSAAMLEMGALLGALLAGALADRFSRKRSLLVACSKYPSVVLFPPGVCPSHDV